jgi:hypothetical protein
MNRNLRANIFEAVDIRMDTLWTHITVKKRLSHIHFNSILPCPWRIISGLFLPGFTTNILYTYFMSHACYMVHPTHFHFMTHSSVSSCTAHPMVWSHAVMLLITQLSLASHSFLSWRPIYYLQHCSLTHTIHLVPLNPSAWSDERCSS